MNHSFDVEHAQRYGIAEAVLIQHFTYWINKNEANEKHFYKGRYWTYSSAKALTLIFPYLSEKQIRTAMHQLIEAGVLITDCFNKDNRDRTKWYAFSGSSICPNGKMDVPKWEAPTSAQMGRPLPNVITDVIADVETDIRSEKKFAAAGSLFGDAEEIAISSINQRGKEEKLVAAQKEENKAQIRPEIASSYTDSPLVVENAGNRSENAAQVHSATNHNPTKPESVADAKKKQHKRLTEIWFTAYQKRTGIKPLFTGKEAKAMQGVVQQLWNIVEDKSEIVYIFETILNKWDELPRWYQSNLTLAIINGKLNEILNCLKNGHSENSARNGFGGSAINGSTVNAAFDNFYKNR